MARIRTDPFQCTVCGKINDAFGSLNCDATPEPGSITICIQCGTISVFEQDLSLRNATEKDLLEIKKNAPDTYTLILQSQEFIINRNRRN